MDKDLTINSPYLERLFAWSSERFPIANFISAALGFIVLATVSRSTVADTSWSLVDMLGVFAYTGQLLLLRIFDEFKDYEKDMVAHPNRIIQRGLFLLSELKPLAILSLILGLGWSFAADAGLGPTVLTWIAMMLFTYLMTYEFFIGDWLKKNIFLYGLSHSLVSGFISLWIFTGTRGILAWDFKLVATLIISLAFALSYEITRKTFGLEEEKPLQDSYSRDLGFTASIGLSTFYNLIIFMGYIALCHSFSPSSIWPYAAFLLCYSCTFYPTFNMLKKQDGKARKMAEGGLGLFVLGGHITLLLTIKYGL